MLIPAIRNTIPRTGKLIFFFFLLFLSAGVSAQLSDTLAVTEEVETETDDYDNEEEDEAYFLEKQETDTTGNLTLRKVPVDRVRAMKEDDAFWYANAEFEEEKKKKEPRFENYIPIVQRSWFQTILWFVIIGGFTAFLIMYLSSNNVGLFRKRDRTLEENGEEEMETADIFSINFQKEIEKAAAQGNFRLAIRLMYLRILKEMSEKNIIHYTQDKTNFDYLLQVHPTPYYKDFFRITRHYEYSWYGQFDISEDAYRVIRQDVNQFERELR